MEVISAIASIVTLIALAKEISSVAKDLLQGYTHAPKELSQLSEHISLIILELECLHMLQDAADTKTCLTNGESLVLNEALTTAKKGITTLQNTCTAFSKHTKPLSQRVCWVLFDSKTAEHVLVQIQRIEHHFMFILQVIDMCRASRAQVENRRQLQVILQEMRGCRDDIHKIPTFDGGHRQMHKYVADSEDSVTFQHKSTRQLSEYWKQYLPFDFSCTTSGNEFQAVHEMYLRLPVFMPGGRIAFALSLSLRRSLGYLPSISIRGGGLHCFNIVPFESEIIAACLQGDVLAVRTLFSEKKASPNDMTTAYNRSNRTLIYYATRSGSTELVRFLISVGAPVQSGELFVTSFWRNPSATRLLLENGAGLDVLGKNGYTFATFMYGKSRPRTAQTELIDILAEKGFPYFNTQESNGWTVMHRAAAWGTSADIKALHRCKASTDMQSLRFGWTPIFLAVSYKNMDTFQALWECSSEQKNRIVRDFRGWNLLHIAVCYDNFEAVRWLLERGMDMECRSEATSSFVPPLLRGKRFTPGDLARNCGEEAYTKWAGNVKSAGKVVDVQPGDIDWSQEEVDGFFPLCECCDQWIVQSTN